MHPRQPYKKYLFCHPRETWVFSKLQGLEYYFRENFRSNLTYYESETFSDSSLHHIFESENFRFPFCTKNSLTWEVKCENLTSENRREFIRWAAKIVHEWNGHLELFSPLQVIENSRQYLLLRTDILQKTVVGYPVKPVCYLKHLAYD